MASSSVSQDDHDVEHDFAIASRRAKVRSARANRAVNITMSCRGLGEELERGEHDGGEQYHHHHHIPKYDQQTSVVLLESNDASPKPIIRGLNKEKMRPIPSRGAHAGKSNKGIRDRRKLREKRRSTAIGVMHLPSTESTGGSTGEDENEENSVPTPVAATASAIQTKVVQQEQLPPVPPEETKVQIIHNKGKSESDLDADDEAAQDSSDLGLMKIHVNKDDTVLRLENQRLKDLAESKDRRIAMLELQVAQLTKQMDEIKDKLMRTAGEKT